MLMSMTGPSEYALRIDRILSALNSAAGGDEPARNISEALYSADCFGKHRLDRHDAEKLRQAAVNAASTACEAFPAWVPRSHIRQGFRAFLDWCDVAQLDPAERRILPNLDRAQRLRTLRNHAHSVSLQIDIAERAASDPVRASAQLRPLRRA